MNRNFPSQLILHL
uniref:Uncharacterized protein n=1 Tax=Anguilla anguilla TaxID=7936 RepID=A0A0E9PCE7_ANGAN